MCTNVLPVYMSEHPSVCLIPRETRRGIGSLGLELEAVVSHTCMLGTECCPLEEQTVVLTAQPALKILN